MCVCSHHQRRLRSDGPVHLTSSISVVTYLLSCKSMDTHHTLFFTCSCVSVSACMHVCVFVYVCVCVLSTIKAGEIACRYMSRLSSLQLGRTSLELASLQMRTRQQLQCVKGNVTNSSVKAGVLSLRNYMVKIIY